MVKVLIVVDETKRIIETVASAGAIHAMIVTTTSTPKIAWVATSLYFARTASVHHLMKKLFSWNAVACIVTKTVPTAVMPADDQSVMITTTCFVATNAAHVSATMNPAQNNWNDATNAYNHFVTLALRTSLSNVPFVVLLFATVKNAASVRPLPLMVTL